MDQGGESLRMQEILQCVSAAILNEGKRRALLKLRGDNAQSMIDYLNALLSHPDLVDSKLRKHILIVLRKLCENSMLYPSCYPLDGIEDISSICAGGFCDIYQGRYRGQTLCLKVVRLYQRGDQNKMLKAHAREAILWSHLKHRNVTPFYGIFYLEEVQKRISLLSPWMNNGNVVNYLKGDPQIPRKPFLYDIASGLEYLHKENIIHGDLKGANVLVDESSTARLADFGLSKIQTDTTLGFVDTSDGIAGFTTNWAAPELTEDNARHTRESDIWAFGCVCYEILTGLSPFHGCTAIQVVRKLICCELPAQPIDVELDPDTVTNKKIWSLVKQCWSFEATRRPKCEQILQKMRNDAMLWQPRAGESNTEGQVFLYTPRLRDPVLGLDQRRWFMEIIGFREGMGREESWIVDDRHSNGDQVFINECTSTSLQSPRIHCSRQPLPNPSLQNPRGVTGIFPPPSLHSPAAHPSLSSPSFGLSSAEENTNDQQEDETGMNGGESQIVNDNRPSENQMPLINQCFSPMPACLSSCFQFLCCKPCCPRSPPLYTTDNQLDHPMFDNRASDEFRPPPARVSHSATQIDAVELNEIQAPRPHDSVAIQSPHLPRSCNAIVSTETQQPPQRRSSRFLLPSLPPSLDSLSLERPNQPSSRYSLREQRQNQGLLSPPNVLGLMDSTSVDRKTMGTELLESIMFGAGFDSPDRDPPPRCFPGTRSDIINRCLHFIANCSGEKKILLVLGATGVGKTTILQSVAESPGLAVSSLVSVFLSVNGRNYVTKVIMTICYQLAVQSDRYREFFLAELGRNRSLLHWSMDKQFGKLIAEPSTRPQLISTGRVLIIIDGLDECESQVLQKELLHIISDFCITYPSSPLVWLISSRPEQHILSFFSSPTVRPTYEKEEISVGSEDSCEDVKLFLRHRLEEIKKVAHLPDPQSEWPKERDFLALANASNGLFAYAHSVIKYIDNLAFEDPVSKFRDVLKIINGSPTPNWSPEEHPLALLDVLYARILSSVPPEVLDNTRKLLLALVLKWDWFLYPGESNFIVLCNWLSMTVHGACLSLFPLLSVLHFTMGSPAVNERIKIFHKSFIDYISDFSRSGLFRDIQLEARQLKVLCTERILKEAPDGIDFGKMDYKSFFGDLARGPGMGDKISLTWPLLNEEAGWSDHKTRLSMYKTAIGWAMEGIRSGEPDFQTPFYIRLLTARFTKYDYFPYDELSDLVFHESRRDEFTRDSLIKEVPLEAIDFSNPDVYIRLWFYHPVSPATNISDPWDSTCTHKRKGEWGNGKIQDWTTNIPLGCNFCWKRFKQQLNRWKIQTPDNTVPTLFSSTGKCCVEFKLSDSEVDGLSGAVWTYRLWVKLSFDERKKYGSTV